MWKVKQFNELSVNELYKIMYLRVATFVVEQDRVYQEVDKDDLKAIHVFKEDHDGEIIAYARIFPVGKDTVTFGRVVTSQRVRGYQQVGFKTEGDEFIFESTPHIKMVHDGIK